MLPSQGLVLFICKLCLSGGGLLYFTVSWDRVAELAISQPPYLVADGWPAVGSGLRLRARLEVLSRPDTRASAQVSTSAAAVWRNLEAYMLTENRPASSPARCWPRVRGQAALWRFHGKQASIRLLPTILE